MVKAFGLWYASGAIIVEMMKFKAVEATARIVGQSHGLSEVTMCRTMKGEIR